MALHAKVDEAGGPAELDLSPAYGHKLEHPVPKHELPHHPMPADMALRLVTDELMLDGNARLNLATFVTTWMEPQAEVLMTECFSKNMIDKDEYPQTAELERRCVNILAHLWHAPAAGHGDDGAATGCSTTGSSEACMLGGLALLWRWRARQNVVTDHRPTARPNLVMGANVQVCWEKFCRYWEVEPRLVPMEPGRLHLAGPEAVATLRREHDRRGRHSRAPPWTAATSRWRRSRPRWMTTSSRPGSTSRCTSTARPADSSRRSLRPAWSGISGCRGSRRSTRPVTSTAWCIRASAGSSGATRLPCLMTWCSR